MGGILSGGILSVGGPQNTELNYGKEDTAKNSPDIFLQ